MELIISTNARKPCGDLCQKEMKELANLCRLSRGSRKLREGYLYPRSAMAPVSGRVLAVLGVYLTSSSRVGTLKW